MKGLSLFLVLGLSLAACAPESSFTQLDPIDANDVDVPADSAEANGLLEFLNDEAVTFDVLDAIVDARAAEGLVAGRPFASIDAVDTVPYVGPVTIEKLLAHLESNGWIAYQGGAWEGVAFTGSQVALVLDLAGGATLEQLDVDAGLDVRAAENILDARPITSMHQLGAVPYVGPSALKKLRAYLPKWQENGTSVEVYDGVVFTHLEAARALAAANDANLDALSSVGIVGSPASIILGGRPWNSLSQLSSRAGIGSLTVSRLRTLGQAYEGAEPYVVTAADVADFETKGRDLLRDDSFWAGEMVALLGNGDLSGSPTWAASAVEKITLAIEARLAAFTNGEAGRTYSSRDAALASTLAYVANLKLAAKSDYPAGALTIVAPLTQAEGLARAKTALLHYWQHEFVGSPEWNATFDNRTWDDVKGQVGADIAAYETGGGYQVMETEAGLIFLGSVYSLYNEATVDPLGKVPHVLVEID